ncbi:hypothetical protein MNEG_4300 [Monoraphidium neglectum]|uniref:Protein LURP-one-related 15 n=1 Tax=Monoraphidium neglectum TaxID=145388 RepID=A0A0D2MTB4_9CHLO|nr:hypothetical protein MNEG_4300 [Monoraphidium neglectum]KIZ03657.1 hypothetical protein MNEG_4300 [Monoraphidium neglectum]|eukprot:XP_013902676.1 hypothetical protein MNEG_4300 [Monoraphidium neglectum]
MSDKRVLMDASGQSVVGMAKKLLSMKPTWIMYRGASFAQGTQVAVVKAHHSLTPSVSVYLNDGDKESDFKIRGNFRSKRFAITQKLGSGGQERPIAEVKKESKFSSVTAFLTSAMTAADNYFIHIEPGVDAAFIVAIAVLVDELFHDEKTT